MVWTHELGTCISCDENSLVFTDPNISPFCYIADGTNEKACELRYDKLICGTFLGFEVIV